jgi:hypothetical protein
MLQEGGSLSPDGRKLACQISKPFPLYDLREIVNVSFRFAFRGFTIVNGASGYPSKSSHCHIGPVVTIAEGGGEAHVFVVV